MSELLDVERITLTHIGSCWDAGGCHCEETVKRLRAVITDLQLARQQIEAIPQAITGGWPNAYGWGLWQGSVKARVSDLWHMLNAPELTRTCTNCGEVLTPIREIGDGGQWVTSWMHTRKEK